MNKQNRTPPRRNADGMSNKAVDTAPQLSPSQTRDANVVQPAQSHTKNSVARVSHAKSTTSRLPDTVSLHYSGDGQFPWHHNIVSKVIVDKTSPLTIITASRDSFVKKWNIHDLVEDTNSLAAMSTDYGPSSSRRTAKRINLEYTLAEHTHWVNDIVKVPHETKDVLVSCSSDKTLKVWSVPFDSSCSVDEYVNNLDDIQVYFDNQGSDGEYFCKISGKRNSFSGFVGSSMEQFKPSMANSDNSSRSLNSTTDTENAVRKRKISFSGVRSRRSKAALQPSQPQFSLPDTPGQSSKIEHAYERESIVSYSVENPALMPKYPFRQKVPAFVCDSMRFIPSIDTHCFHKDYAVCLAYAHTIPSQMASGGFDGYVYIFDLEKALQEKLTFCLGKRKATCGISRGKHSSGIFKANCIKRNRSVWALDINPNGSAIVVGDTERSISGFSLEDGHQIFNLPDCHDDTIRRLSFSSDKKKMISVSSDKKIKLWDMRMCRVIETICCHDGSVWALHANLDQQDQFFTGGRDGSVFAHSWSSHGLVKLRDFSKPVVSIDVNHNVIAASTLDSSVHMLKYENSSSVLSRNNGQDKQAKQNPFKTIKQRFTLFQSNKRSVNVADTIQTDVLPGIPKLCEFKCLGSQFEVLTRDMNKNVKLWNLLKDSTAENNTELNFDDDATECLKPVWYSPDTCLGCLRISLRHPSVFFTELKQSSFLLADEKQEKRLHKSFEANQHSINIGAVFCKNIFEQWTKEQNPKQPTPIDGFNMDAPPASEHLANGQKTQRLFTCQESSGTVAVLEEPCQIRIKFPRYTIVSIWDSTCNQSSTAQQSRMGVCTPTVSLLKNLQLQAHGPNPTAVLPPWLCSYLFLDTIPEVPQTTHSESFYLTPVPDSPLPSMGQTVLLAKKNLKIENVMIHVLSKISYDFGSQRTDHSNQQRSPASSETRIPSDYIFMSCRDKILNPEWTLGAVKELIWCSDSIIDIRYGLASGRPRSYNSNKAVPNSVSKLSRSESDDGCETRPRDRRKDSHTFQSRQQLSVMMKSTYRQERATGSAMDDPRVRLKSDCHSNVNRWNSFTESR